MNEQVDSLIVTEDGSLELGNNIENIIFHQDLNVFLITTKDNSIRVFDPHSSLKLADVSLAKYVPDPGGKIQCMYHGETGGIISCGGKNLGMRHDHQGILLLHTILQTQVASHEETVTLDILLSEAIQLQQVFWEVNNIENANEVKEALAQAMNEPLLGPSSNPKIGKWRTVCLTMSVGTLRSACASLVSQLRHLAYFIPALSLASALYHRLNHLSPAVVTDVTEIDKESMFSEADRLATFSNWPHMNYKWALPDQMAQAGFFHQLFANDEDRAMCFICNVCLVYWEPTDEPWSEHERHSPNCPYVKGEYTHNVPLSITHATGPAMPHSERSESIHRISISNSKLFLASATAHGSIVVWNIAKQLKKEITFMIDPSDSTILDKHFSDTIGYTDIPLQLHSPPRDVWEVPSLSTSERENKDSSGSTASSSKLMQKLYPSVPQDASSDPLSSLVSLYEEPDVDYSGKEYLDAQDSLSHLVNISGLIDSYSSLNEVDVKSSNEEALEPPETQSMSPVDKMNYIQCIDLSDVLPIDNFGHISDPVSLVDSSVKTDLMDATPKMGVSGVLPSAEPQMPCDKLEFPIEDISDELFAPPRLSHDVRVSSLCVFTEPSSFESPGSSADGCSLGVHRVCLAVGVGLRRYDLFGSLASEGIVQALNDANQATSKETKPPLDIMKLEKLVEAKPDLDGDLLSETSPSSSTASSSSSSSVGSSRKVINARNSSSPKNFVPYLLIYDLSILAQSHVITPKQNGASVPQGTSKKSTRKVAPTNYSLVKVMKGELSGDFISNYSSNEGKLNNIKDTSSGVPREGLTPLKKVPKCAQCIPLPHKLHKLKLQLFVDLILISPCGQYLLVSLQQLQKNSNETHPLHDESSPTCVPSSEDRSVVTGGFILYRICNSDESLFVQEDPVSTNLFCQSGHVAKEIIMIPTLDNTILGSLAAVVCLDGALRILSLTLLEYIQEIIPQDKKFNSITYCHSLERLCVTKEDGKVVLFQVQGDEDPIDDNGAGSTLASLAHSGSHGSRAEGIAVDREMDLQSAELLINKNLNEETLDKCLELTQFQSGCPRFVATVPPCWEKVIQAQKKRRNPQHLQHQSEKMDNAMTWRLESERSTVDEHMLDILLPLSGSPGSGGIPQIGHIDVKLNFISGVVHPLPKIQITLLKQNLKTRTSACQNLLNDHLGLPRNPVVTNEFLMAHAGEILCGPVTVNQFVDLTGQAANLTLTSRDLLACKARNFLIHIKAIKLKENEDEEDSEPSSGLDLLSQYVPPQSTTFFDKLSSSSANIKRGEAPKGCNVIEDLTLTIHCFAKSNIPHERLQRLAMIEKGSFHSELITAIVNPTSTPHIQHRSLDVLLWILCIHTASEHRSAQKKELLSRLQDSVTSFIQTCLLAGDRSLAHKMTKIILTALQSISTNESRMSFGRAMLSALLDSMDVLPQCRSAGAVYWFFSLLNHVKWCNPAATTDKVTELLSVMSEVLSQKMDPLHALLQTTFGLYGVPFERHVFDTFPPLLMKQLTPVSQNSQKHNGSNQQSQYHHHTTTTTNGNNNLLSSHQGNGSWNKYDCPNLLWAGSNPSLKSPLGGTDNSDLEIILGQNGVTLGLTPQIGGLCGLLEVEPLHFTLYMASDGTKIERVYPGSGYSTGAYVIQPTSNTETDSTLSHDSSKAPSDSMPPPQLHKAVEDMKNMVMKDQAVALLLSKKAKKSYLEKLKRAAKQKAQKIMKLNTSVLSSSIQGIDSVAGNKAFKAHLTDSNSTSILSSDLSPEGTLPPPLGLLSPKPPILHNEAVDGIMDDFLGNPLVYPSSTPLEGVNPDSPIHSASSHTVDPIQERSPDANGAEDHAPVLTEVVGNISEGIANSLFGPSGLNSSLNLSEHPRDVSSHTFHQNMPPMEVVDISNDADKPRSTSQTESDNLFFTSSQSELLCIKEVCKALHSNWTPLETISEQTMEKMKIEKCSEDLSIPQTGPTSDDATIFPLKESQDAKSSALPTSGVPYQQLLSTPPQQMIVIEQMHSGARRFVILDFGAPVVLTDVIIPACSDLVSLTIDIWLKGEEIDGERLAVASDIGFRPLVLADLQAPPLCRFLKVTALGRYGMSNSQCRIPVGAFYGHTIILPWDLQPSQEQVTVTTKKVAKMQLAILNNMVEDVSCRYSLACSKLKALLQPHWKASSVGGVHLSSANLQSGSGNASANVAQEKKIMICYQECLTEQQQLNLILAVIRRLQKFIGISSGMDSRRRRFSFQGSPFVTPGDCPTDATGSLVDYRKELEACSADQLSTLVQALLNCLLTIAFPPPTNDVQIQLLSWCGPTQAKALIENVCIRGPKGAQVAVVSLLARLCTNQAWWGQFLASTLVSLFTTGESSHFPATRIFALLTFLGQKSVQCGRGTHVIDAVVQSLLTELQKGSLTPHWGEEGRSPEQARFFTSSQGLVDPRLISWLLLFLSLCLDLVVLPKNTEGEKTKDGGRWSWLSAESSLQKKGSDATKGTTKASRELLRRRLVHHKQQLVNLETASKSFGEVLAGLENVINPKMFKQSEQVFKKIQKQHAMKHYKDLCSIQRNETSSLRKLGRNNPGGTCTGANADNKSNKEESSSCTRDGIVPVDRVRCLSVAKALIKLLTNTQFPCTVDTFLLACKVIGGLGKLTRPSLKVSEFLNEEQLGKLLTHCMTLDSMWGSPWAVHALTCLLQDILEGESSYGMIVLNVLPSPTRPKTPDTNATDNNKEGRAFPVVLGVENSEEDVGERCLAPQDLSGAQAESRMRNKAIQPPSDVSSFVPLSPTPLNSISSEGLASHLVSSSSPVESNDTSTVNDPLILANDVDGGPLNGRAGPSTSLSAASQSASLHEAPNDDTPAVVGTEDLGLGEEEQETPTETSSLSAVVAVTSSSHADQSATAASLPIVNVATSHFAPIKEEEGSLYFRLCWESDESSPSDDMIEFFSEVQTHLNSLPVSSSGLKYLPQLLPNSIYSPTTPLKKESGRVGDLLTAPLASYKAKMGPDHSTAVDARLENGLALAAEHRIHMMNAIHASRLCAAVSAPLQVSPNTWDDKEMYRGGNMKPSIDLLSLVFQSTLSQMSLKFEGNQLELILELWLNLNLDLAGEDYNSLISPTIPLQPQTISALLSAVARSQNISIRCWCLVLQTLTLCSNLNPPLNSPDEGTPLVFSAEPVTSFDPSWMSTSIISDRNFIPVLQKLLSGHYTGGMLTRCDVVGNTLINLLEDLLVRFEVRCDVISPESAAGNAFKFSLLKLVMRLLEPDAPLARGLGPLDVQKTLLTIILSMHYNGLHKTHIAVAIVSAVANVVNRFLSSEQDVTPGSSSEPNSSTLGGLFASVLGADGQQEPVPTRRTILCALVNLAKKLVELPLEPLPKASVSTPPTATVVHNSRSGGGDPSYYQRCLTDSLKLEQKQQLGLTSGHASQTDEHKAMNPPPGEESTGATNPILGAAIANDSIANAIRSRSPIGAQPCFHNLPDKIVYVADTVLQDGDTMQLLIHSLRWCEGSASVPLNLIGVVSGDVSETLGIGKTLADALYQLLVTINQKATTNDLLLEAIFRYLMPSYTQTVFSEGLFCFYIQVLNCETMLRKFSATRGTELIWDNLAKSVGAFGGPRTGLISSVMNHLSPSLPPSTLSSTSHRRIDPSTGNLSTMESGNPRGLFNFAPLAAVTSSNPTARPADALVKSTQFFQRAKSPLWSYHFSPEENWVDLNLTLPCPILLHEVQLQPHTMPLGICPSGISLETGIEGGCLIPVTGMVCTAGLSCINVSLRNPVVASVVVVRLHRPRDQSTLGLSHLKLFGTTTFKNKVPPRDATWEQGPHKSSYWWLRLVDHCMFDVPGGFDIMMESGPRVQGVIEAMVALLATSCGQPNIPPSTAPVDILGEAVAHSNCELINTLASTLISNTTYALVSCSQEMLHRLVKCLFNHPIMLQPMGSSSSVDAAVALLCRISISREGATLLVEWFTRMLEETPGGDVGDTSGEGETAANGQSHCVSVNPEILHCFAAILWNANDNDVATLITDSLFRKVYRWCEKTSGAIKEGLDYIICSLCKVRPHFFTHLLLYMGFLTVIDCSSTSITDDRKDREAEIRASYTDDMKGSREGCPLPGPESRLILQDPSVISIAQHHLQTLAFAAQSPSAIRLMLESGFPLLLVHGILEWCKVELLHQVESCATPSTRESATDHEKSNGPHASTSSGASEDGPTPPPSAVSHDTLPPFSTDLVVDTLETLTALCAERQMKDWLGFGEGSVFWIPILTVLGDPVMHGSEISMRVGGDPSYGDYSRVEDATISLIREVCCNHDQNQKLLASTLCHLIQRQNAPPPGGLTYLHSLSGFTRRLVLQILLETENVLVQVTSKFCLSQPPLHTTAPNSGHPRFGAGNKTRLMQLPITTKMDEVVKMVTDWWQQGVTQAPLGSTGDSKQNQDFEAGSSFKKEIREVGLELVDKLSVAAGVTAKEKRMRDKGQNKGTTTKNRKRESSQCKNTTQDIGFGGTSPLLTHGLTHDELLGGGSVLPGTLTLSQVLAALGHHGSPDPSQLKFNLVFTKDACQESIDSCTLQSLLKTKPRPSMLSVFSSQGGLSILAQHMALLYPDTSYHYMTSLPPKMTADDKKEKSLEDESGLYIDMNYSSLPDCLTGNSLSTSPGFVRNAPVGLFGAMPIPPHALGAFTLFLRLPGYAEMLLTDNVKACCLLRSALGVYDNIYEGENTSSFVGSLATLPFQVLEVLLKSTPLTTDDGLMLRKMCLKTGVLHLILACLSALSHQDSPEVITSLQHPSVPIGLVVATARASCPSQSQGTSTTRNDNERCHYWAKGTGFGTGSTNQSWNVEQALIKQKLEEQHVVWLIKLLAQYINPGDNLGEDLQQLCQEEMDKVLSSTIQDSAPSREIFNSLSSSYSFAPATCSSQCQVPQSAPTQDESGPTLPSEIYDLFVKAGLVSKISSYLSNDSVLDMSRHVPLYQALMALVRAIAVTPSLSTLFLSPGPDVTTTAQETTPPCEGESPGSSNLPALLTKMKTTVNTYMTKLKWKSDKVPVSNPKPRKTTPSATTSSTFNIDEKPFEMSVLQSMSEELENEDQGLSLLVPDIQLSTKVVEIVMERLYNKEADERRAKENGSENEPEAHLSQVDVYLKSMKPLQFDSYEMIVEDTERGIRFVVPYHYEGLVRDAGETFNPRRMKRLAQEAVTLSMSLPLSYSSSVFVRTDVDRLDVMKVLITGPEDTPYANGCFEFDVYFSNNYPSSPLYINLQTTGEKRMRFNPNLYQDGKVCLSILNTWHGRPEEKWNPQTSSLLQVLVSIQSLILVPDPYFNEPGYERSRGSQAALHNSQEYDANIRVATIRWAILNQLRNPSPCFKEVIERHFWLKRKDILTQVEGWITELEALSENKRVGRMIPHHAVKMKKLYQWLSEDFSKMVAPTGLECATAAQKPTPPVTTQAAFLSSDDEEASPLSRRIRKPLKGKVPLVSPPEVSCSMPVSSNSPYYFYLDKSTSFPADGTSTTLMDAATTLSPSSQPSSGGDSDPVGILPSSQDSKISLVHPVSKNVNCASSVQEETAESPMATGFHNVAPQQPSHDVKDEFSLSSNSDSNQT